MTDVNEMVGQRHRSPAFPVVPLETALERLAEFEEHYKRSGARPEKVGEACAGRSSGVSTNYWRGTDGGNIRFINVNGNVASPTTVGANVAVRAVYPFLTMA